MDASSAVALWDALTSAGRDFGLRPAGLAALDLVRLEAGLILLEVDYTSSRHAVAAEQAVSPYELGLGRLVDLDKSAFVGRRALIAEMHRGGPRRRLGGIAVEWDAVERLSLGQGVPPSVSASVSRAAVPLFGAGGRQVGRVTSSGWSPTLKRVIGLASIDAASAGLGTRLGLEWTVEGRRGVVPATVVDLPFLDLPRKRSA